MKSQLFSTLKRKLSRAHGSHNSPQVVRDRYKLCPSCGNFSSVAEDHAFCILCGDQLIEECQRCHEPIIYPTARYCPMCGEELSAPQDQHVRHHDHYHSRRQRRIEHHLTTSSQFLEQYPE